MARKSEKFGAALGSSSRFLAGSVGSGSLVEIDCFDTSVESVEDEGGGESVGDDAAFTWLSAEDVHRHSV